MRKLDGNEDENLFSRDGSKQTLFSNKTCGNPELNPQLFQLKAVKNGNCPAVELKPTAKKKHRYLLNYIPVLFALKSSFFSLLSQFCKAQEINY